MVQAYSSAGLNEPAEGGRRPRRSSPRRGRRRATYAQLAVLAYQAGQTRKGDLAAKKALAADAPRTCAQNLKAQLDQAKQQSAAAGRRERDASATRDPDGFLEEEVGGK